MIKYSSEYKYSNKEIIKLLITDENKNIQDDKGETPLHIALVYNQPNEIIKLFVNVVKASNY